MGKFSSEQSNPKSFYTAGLKKTFLSLGVTCETIDRLERESNGRKLISAFSLAAKRDEKEIIEIVSKRIFVEQYELGDLKQLRKNYNHQFKSLFSKPYVLENRIFPIKNDNGNIIVGFADPLDIDVFNDIRFLLCSPVKAVIMSERQIVEAINVVFSEISTGDFGVEFSSSNEEGVVKADSVENPSDRTLNTEEVGTEPVIRLVNNILSKAASAGTSDIHLEPTQEGLDVRYRVDGVVSTVLQVPKGIQPYLIARIKLLAGMDISERRRPQDGRFRIQVADDQSRDLRVSSVRTPFGEKLVLRLLNSGEEAVTLDSIGMDDSVKAHWQRALKCSDRIVIVCGPTGSGKSTTLFASITEMRTGDNNIVTVEDPIEYRIEGATQIEINPKIGVTFAAGLRSILRQDPDVILVGEVRDLETAEIAFQAAQTGHQVLTTLHTNDAASTIIRLIDMGLEPAVIAASLGAVVAQRLVRTICPDCKCSASAEQAAIWSKETGIAATELVKGEGCSNCGFSGYKGRTAVYSLLSITAEIRELIRQGASESAIENAGRKEGLKTLRESSLELVRKGVTTVEEVNRVIGIEFASDAKLLAVDSEKERNRSVRENLTTEVSNYRISKNDPAAAQPKSITDELNITIPGGDEQGSVLELAESLTKDAVSPVKVLLIDDDPRIRSLMSTMLRSCGFEITQACHGLHALQQLEASIPDIIICDLEMPVLNGLDFIKRLRSIEEFRNIPAIMLTSADAEENEIEMLSVGANDFVSKTASMKLVATRINKLLDAH